MDKYPYEEELSEFLKSLSDVDLFALANTVSQGLLKQKNQDEKGAIRTILKYSPNTTSILKRKSITREILFNYLDEKNVTVTLPTTKDALIDKVLQFWGRNDENVQNAIQNNPETAPLVQNVYNVYVAPQQINENRSDASQLALKFSEWFYSIMNSDEIIPVEHFYPDSILKLNLISSTVVDSNKVDNDPQEIVKLLYNTKLKHGLYFNPNLSDEGVKGKITPHGLVLVASCGSIHVSNQCVGVFEQVFGLAKDPFAENNWKIKYTELNLKNQTGVITSPILEMRALDVPEILEIMED